MAAVPVIQTTSLWREYWALTKPRVVAMLMVTAVAMLGLKLEATGQWRPFFVFAGLWFIALPPAAPRGRQWIANDLQTRSQLAMWEASAGEFFARHVRLQLQRNP